LSYFHLMTRDFGILFAIIRKSGEVIQLGSALGSDGRNTMSWNHVEAVLILGPIVGLLALGIGLALRSGVVNVSTGQGMRRLASNLSHTVLIIGACLVVLILIQQLAGIRMRLFW